MYIVHMNYGRLYEGCSLHLVRKPNGKGETFTTEQLKKYLVGKTWKYA